jgi:hypothetical protein
MTPFQEKIYFGVITLASTSVSTVGAILTTGEVRWLYVTLATSILTSGFVSLMLKKPAESVQLVIGRCGLAIIGGVLATKPVINFMNYEEAVKEDMILLALLAAVTCIATFCLSMQVFRAIERTAPKMVDKMFKKFFE